MRPELVLVLPLVLSASSARGVGSTPQRLLGKQEADNHLVPYEPTVTGSLVDVWNTFGNFATSLYSIRLVPDKGQGRGHKSASMIIPLILGFKLSGAIVAGLAALKVIVLKTAAMSSLALLVSLAIGAKYIYDKLQKQHHDYSPHYYPPHVKDSGWGSEYEVQTGHTEVFSGGHTVIPSSDLQGYHSDTIPQSVEHQPNLQISEETEAQRKVFRGSPKFKTTVYKTKYKMNG